MAGVIVRISGPNKTVVRHVVPFLARDLTCFAADANCRIGEETDLHIFLHVIVPALVRALCPFADHRIDSRALIVLFLLSRDRNRIRYRRRVHLMMVVRDVGLEGRRPARIS
jgi:hypothetical protein